MKHKATENAQHSQESNGFMWDSEAKNPPESYQAS